MNDSDSTPPPLPQSAGHPSRPLFSDAAASRAPRPAECEPTLAGILEGLLKHPDALLQSLGGPLQGRIIARLIAITLICGAVYGLVMGSLSGGVQLWASPAKLTTGLFASVLLCLPSLYIFLCLNGADVRPAQIGGAALGMVALTTLLLIGFAPVAWIFSQSTDSVAMMGALHLVFWIIGLWFGIRLVKGLLTCADTPAYDQGHLKVWIIIFALVSLQMTSVLRPLIGTAPTLLPTEKKFFVQHWLDSAK